MKSAQYLLPLFVLFLGCSDINHYFGLQDDNIVEEIAEDILAHETGIQADFTPSSREP